MTNVIEVDRQHNVRRRHKTPLVSEYEHYLKKVLIQVHQTKYKLSKQSMTVFNDLFHHLNQRLAIHYNTVFNASNTATLTADMVSKAVTMAFHPSVALQAIKEGLSRIQSFVAVQPTGDGHHQSRSNKAKLIFSVSRAECILRSNITCVRRGRRNRVSANAPVMLAATLEYMAAEILEFAGYEAGKAKMDTITPGHIRKALDRDDDIRESLGQFSIDLN